jgi:excisionase family DNA binding protein
MARRRLHVPESGEFYTFGEVLGRLDISEQKLKRLVSEGEIRAFREGDEMKFKKSDIEGLDVGATEDGETRAIDLSAGGGDASETLTDDLIFDEGDELDLTADDAGMATAEISSQDTFVDEIGEDVGMSTEPLDFDGGDFEDEVDDEMPEDLASPVTAARPRAARRPVTSKYAAPTGGMDVLFSAILVITILVMFFAGFVVWSGASAKGVNSISGGAVKLFAKQYKPAVDYELDRTAKEEEKPAETE